VWIQPAAGDAGGALGAALMTWHQIQGNPRAADGKHDAMQGAYLGPEFDDERVEAFLKAKGYPARKLSEAEWAPTIADVMASENVVGLLQGRMEFGPRALGGRSIVGDARSPKMQSIMNLKIKYRESFRPFAPTVSRSACRIISNWIALRRTCCWWRRCARSAASGRRKIARAQPGGINQIGRTCPPSRTSIIPPASRRSTARRTGRYYDLIKAFEAKTGYGVIINTPSTCAASRSSARPRRLSVLHAHRMDLSRAGSSCSTRRASALDRQEELEGRLRVGLGVAARGAGGSHAISAISGRLLREFGEFAWHNKAWWIVPMVVLLLLLAMLIATGTSVAPFIYTLF
jgi:hypothetical protein